MLLATSWPCGSAVQFADPVLHTAAKVLGGAPGATTSAIVPMFCGTLATVLKKVTWPLGTWVAVTLPGEFTVTKAVKAIPWPTTEASLEVRDNGTGVPPERRQEIFKPYFTTNQKGTGLGLAVVQQIVLAHGWEIECLGNEPKGTVFRITHLKLAA